VIKIGNTHFSSRCILAPLAGISDLPFRTINRMFGCELAFTEMISARSLVFQSTKTQKMLRSDLSDSPLAVQLLGNDPEVIVRAMDLLEDRRYDFVDINAACPVVKVTSRAEGAGLMREPGRLQKLLKEVVRHAVVPVTVKIRSGWDETSRNAVDVALRAEDAGVSGLFIHGRTKEQGYKGTVDYAIIREVKKALKIPVVASGDALSPQLIRRMFEETGCNGITIARGALGNPWIFREARAILSGSEIQQRPSLEEIRKVMTTHLSLCCDFHGDPVGTMAFRKFFGWYTKGLQRMNRFREEAFLARTREEMTAIIEDALPSET